MGQISQRLVKEMIKTKLVQAIIKWYKYDISYNILIVRPLIALL